MKNALTCAGLVALLAFGTTSVAEAQALAQDLWPNQANNEWTYEVSGSLGSGQTRTGRVARRSGAATSVVPLSTSARSTPRSTRAAASSDSSPTCSELARS